MTDDQPASKGVPLSLCQSKELYGVVGCHCLLRGGVCGYRKLREGPHKGRFPSLTEIEVCPMQGRGRRSGL